MFEAIKGKNSSMTGTLILWIYSGMMVLGGLMGFIKAGSKMSLIMSVAFAVPIILVALNILHPSWIADAVIAFLLVYFGMKLAKSRKMMPAGMMVALSILALVGRYFIK
jgi:uncharacterized membrane protein (UPF0136 family)